MVQVDLFKPKGEMPANLDQVLERHKDIQYSSKQRFTHRAHPKLAELRSALSRLLEKLPPKLKEDADARRLAIDCDDRHWTLARLINQRLPHVLQTKDYEFSRATVHEHWDAGLEDIRRASTEQDWLNPAMCAPGLRVYDLT
jgi:NTE family protein